MKIHRTSRQWFEECLPKSSLTILSTKKKICRALFRIRRPCFKRKCTMRVNSVFRAALKSGVDTSSNLLSDSKSSVTKSYDIFFRRILRLLWLSEISQRKSFQLEMCLPGRLSRSNDFWSAKRNWFHYFQIIRQLLFGLNFTENGRKSLIKNFFPQMFCIFTENLQKSF